MDAAAASRRYQARPGRRAVVAASLSALHGPASGKHVLPLRLYWSPPGRVFDLDDAGSVQSMYRYVLNEAIREDELAEHLDGERLAAVWPALILPRGVRRAWEEQHPQLAAASAAAA
ncbi:MAG: hypothetical protein ACRDNZ_00945 [Streptosporangiaceae bacterium]